MESGTNDYDTNEVVLERVGGGPSHVVLTDMSTSDAIHTRDSRFKKARKKSSTSSKRIPTWLWIIIAKSLGIRLKSGEKPFLSSVLHLLTFGSATCKPQMWSNLIFNRLICYTFILIR